jgi:hypothetical protein
MKTMFVGDLHGDVTEIPVQVSVFDREVCDTIPAKSPVLEKRPRPGSLDH